MKLDTLEKELKVISDDIQARVKKLEETAKELNLPLNYTEFRNIYKQTVNDKYLTYPKWNGNLSGFNSTLPETISSLISKTEENFEWDMKRTFKVAPKGQIKIVSYHRLFELRCYIIEKYKLDIPYVGESSKEGKDFPFIVKAFANGNKLVKYDEAVQNFILNIIK